MNATMTMSCLLCLLASTAVAGEADFHVATDGKDANPGSQDRPFATLACARDAVRERIKAGLEADVTVLVHGGRYALTAPLVFGPEDSGTEEHAVTYAAAPGETPMISGGRRISGWKNGDAGKWMTPLREVKDGTWTFRNLWVNGRRAVRARFPDTDAETPRVQLLGASLSNDLKTFTIKLAPEVVQAWRSPSDIEVLVDGNWAINRKRVQSVDPKTGTLVMAPPHRKTIPWNQPRKGRWAYLEGSPDFLDQPGEWHLDRKTGVLSYWPLPGEDMTKAEVIAPVLTRLVEVKGTPEKPVRNLHFVGLTFAHTDWQIPDVGYFGVQACHHVRGQGEARAWDRIPCAIRCDYAEGCSFRDGAIGHLGTGGIEFVDGCAQCTLEGNHLSDISANGVMLGGPKTEELVAKDCRIASNHVHATGVEYMGAVGIWVGFAQRAQIVHNRVHDTPYTGISVGWQWNPQPTPCKENLIAWNHIFDVMRNLGDGGGIYTLGFQPGTVLRGNHIHDVRRSRFNQAAPNNGMFIDEGSKGFLFERNVIYATAHQAVRHNQNRPEWHTWKDNHFGGAAPTPAPGKIGSALRGAIEVPHKPDLEPEQLTLEAWIRLGELPTGKDDRRWIASKNANEWAQGHYALMVGGSGVGAYLNIGGGRNNEHHAWSDKGLLKPDTWHHAAMTYDGKDLKVYLDGREVAAQTIGKKRQPGSQPFAIGRRQDRYIAFDGLIDDVRLYNRVLPAADIKTHADTPQAIADPKAETGLVGYWHFDDLGRGKDAVQEIVAKAGLEAPHRKRLLGDE